MQPPLKTKIKITIQSLIYHFCFFSNKINLRLGEIYLSIEAPKGEFGIFLVWASVPILFFIIKIFI